MDARNVADRTEPCLDGDVPAESVCAILLDLHRQEETGLLEVYARGRVFRLALRRGSPIHAHPGATLWRLGEVIEHLGLPVSGGSTSLRRALALSRQRAGEVLVDRGILAPDGLERALKEQIRLRSREFLPLSEGRYRFWRGPGHLRAAPRQPDRWTAPELVIAVRSEAFARRPASARPHRPHRPPRPPDPHEPLRRALQKLEGSTDPYRALGLAPGASPDQVRAAFRRLARAHHPDHLGDVTDPRALRLHARIFAAALGAYQRICR